MFLGACLLAMLRPRREPPGRALWAAGAGLAAVSVLIDFAVGAAFFKHLAFLGLGLTAVWLAPAVDVRRVATLAKVVYGTSLVLSLVTYVLGAPGSWEPYGSSVIPGFAERVSGIFRHANHLGPAAVLYMVLEWIRPGPARVRGPMLGIAVILLILSQSKTALGAAVLVGLLYLTRGRDRRHVATVAGLALAVALPMGLLAGFDPGAAIEASPVSQVTTLTGRTAVWKVGVAAWLDRPITGQGTGVFLDFAAENEGFEWAGQAHNQYVQVAAEHGLIGLVLLVIYVVLMGRIAWRHADATGNASIALVLPFLLRTITETPVDVFSLEHLTVFAMLIAWEREADSRSRALASTPMPEPLALVAPGTAPPHSTPPPPQPVGSSRRYGLAARGDPAT